MPDIDVARLRTEVRERGWSVGFHEAIARDEHSAMQTIAAAFGEPSERDGGPLWPVTPRSPHGTFSTRSGSANLHTDAQYRREPEPSFILFCVRAARSGGHTTVLTAHDASGGLEDAGFSMCDRRMLSQNVWTWSTPAEFVAEEAPGSHPVLPDRNHVRWRRDNLVIADPEMENLADRFESYLENHPARATVPLGPGDFIVCDNYRLLHGRTAFDDPQRLLRRTRLT